MIWRIVIAVLGGLACFVPGFFLSLFLTVPWANHHWAGEAQASLGALVPSFWIGALTAIAGAIILLMKVGARRRDGE